MTGPAPSDFTRWNRAGLATVQYVDGNAAVFLERLRARLAEHFPDWETLDGITPESDSAADTKRYLEALYAADDAPFADDVLWQVTRSTARAGHVLGATLDAYANEGWVGTATQWESLRRLVAMLDYAPHPPASAYTPLALLLKDGMSGSIAAGLQFRYTPADGSAPLLFETLENVEADATRNILRAYRYNRNPNALSGSNFALEGKLDKLQNGDPVVLEDVARKALSAHLLTSVSFDTAADGSDITRVTVVPPLARADGFTLGDTLVHAAPKEKLAVKGPLATSAVIDYALELTEAPTDLAAGDIVTIGRAGAKPFYRRVKRVEGARVVFHRPLGLVDLAHATLAPPIDVQIVRQEGERSVGKDGRSIQAFLVAGDWSWLLSQWLSDIRVVGGVEYLPVYQCTAADYSPVVKGLNEKEGYTTITLAWTPTADGAVNVTDGEPQVNLKNPQSLLAPAQSEGPWRPDLFLQKSTAGKLTEPIVTALPKKTSAGDLAVVQRGHQLAWARLKTVALDSEASEGRLSSEAGFADRGGGPFFASTTFVRGHFTVQAHLANWTRNTTPVGGVRIVLDALPASVRAGLAVIAANGASAVCTNVAAVNASVNPPYVDLRDAVPAGTTRENLLLYGNVAMTGHGETKPARVLGSGDATASHQKFALAVGDVSFVADAAMPSGVRADVQVTVADETWTQIANLNDSGPTDAHYHVRQQEDGTLLIGFGDGAHGRRLPTGANNVRVVYRQGNGGNGNLAAGSLSKLAKPHASVKEAVQPIAASGGGARESADAIRTNAAATLLALERAVSLEDFTHLARSQAAVAQARAFALAPGRGQRENLEVRIIPSGGAAFTVELGAQIRTFLLAHALPGVQLAVKGYDAVLIGFEVDIRVRRDAFDGDTVAANVRSALIAAFGIDQRTLGQPLFRGEALAVIEAVAGVENSDCFIVLDTGNANTPQRVVRDADGHISALRVFAQQCAHLPNSNPRIAVTVQNFEL
jgi:hypothetical protein